MDSRTVHYTGRGRIRQVNVSVNAEPGLQGKPDITLLNGRYNMPSNSGDMSAGTFNTGYTDTQDRPNGAVEIPAGSYFANVSEESDEPAETDLTPQWPTGSGELLLRYANPIDGQFTLDIDGAETPISLPKTGDETTWRTASVPVHIAAGKHTVRLTLTKGRANFNWFCFR